MVAYAIIAVSGKDEVNLVVLALPDDPDRNYTVTVDGLCNSDSYVVSVIAYNDDALSQPSECNSDCTMTVVPCGVPYAPELLSVIGYTGSISAAWIAPYNNGCHIGKYIVSVVPVYASEITNYTAVGDSTFLIISGLPNGRAFRLFVSAVNSQVGESVLSS